MVGIPTNIDLDIVLPTVAAAAISAVFLLGRKVAQTSEDIIALTHDLRSALEMADKTISKSEIVHTELSKRIDDLYKQMDEQRDLVRCITEVSSKVDRLLNGLDRPL